jgi:hypothetical protein
MRKIKKNTDESVIKEGGKQTRKKRGRRWKKRKEKEGNEEEKEEGGGGEEKTKGGGDTHINFHTCNTSKEKKNLRKYTKEKTNNNKNTSLSLPVSEELNNKDFGGRENSIISIM